MWCKLEGYGRYIFTKGKYSKIGLSLSPDDVEKFFKRGKMRDGNGVTISFLRSTGARGQTQRGVQRFVRLFERWGCSWVSFVSRPIGFVTRLRSHSSIMVFGNLPCKSSWGTQR